jgi:hypothetical protein
MNDQHDTFIAILQNLSGRATNKVMQQELGWDKGDYLKVRGELLKAGTIQLGRCRGGMVMFKEPYEPTEPTTATPVHDPFAEWRKFD